MLAEAYLDWFCRVDIRCSWVKTQRGSDEARVVEIAKFAQRDLCWVPYLRHFTKKCPDDVVARPQGTKIESAIRPKKLVISVEAKPYWISRCEPQRPAALHADPRLSQRYDRPT